LSAHQTSEQGAQARKASSVIQYTAQLPAIDKKNHVSFATANHPQYSLSLVKNNHENYHSSASCRRIRSMMKPLSQSAKRNWIKCRQKNWTHRRENHQSPADINAPLTSVTGNLVVPGGSVMDDRCAKP